jgi:selenide,water dikinase
VIDPSVLVGAATSDDAAVYRLSDDMALVATLDFITPVVEDPEAFGSVAATNAISDVYAMGGRPIFALNVVNFPRGALPLHYLEAILRGGAAKATEAGIPILGGHSVDDPELKYGMVVLGMIHPDRIVRNSGARVGDLLVLTKPLGIGIITTAIKAQVADDAIVERAVRVMTTLNRSASEAMLAVEAHGATDVTGFGLLGHLAEVVRGSGVGARVRARQVPLIEGTRDLAERGLIPGGSRRNLDAVGSMVRFAPSLSELDHLLLADAQTSGGLLISVAPDRADELVGLLREAGTLASAVVGEITEETGVIQVLDE